MSSEIQKTIEKPWAVFSYIWPLGIGRIERGDRNSVHIRYSEGQFFPLELWDPHYVKRFDTYPEAINYFNSRNRDYSIKRLTEKLFDDFPKAVKKECFQKIHDILFSYANQKAFAQSQPKLTKKVLRQKDEVQLGAHPFKKDDGFVHPNKKY